MMAFGTYSPERADELRNRLDLAYGQVENRARHLLSIAPHTGAISARVDEALESLREVTDDLQEIVDQRTESSAEQEVPW